MKMKLARHIFLLILILSAMLASAQQTTDIPVIDTTWLIEQVNSFSEKTSTISADFTQIKEMSFMEETVTSSGKFYFRKEKQLRWEYTSPFNYSIILSDERIRIIDEGNTREFDASSNRIFLEVSDILAGLVNGTLAESSRFTSTWFESGEYFKVRLVPKESGLKEYLSLIELQLDKSDYSVDALKMFEKSGDYTRIQFKNKKLNENIPEEIFGLD
jgi:outer membrane lipoprotein-sorting protein